MIKYLKGHGQQNNEQAKEMHFDIFWQQYFWESSSLSERNISNYSTFIWTRFSISAKVNNN